MLKALIADDEQSMRFVLEKALTNLGIELVVSVGNGSEAVMAVENNAIDIAFLDVEMPELNGIEAAKLIVDINPKCIIIFITAYTGYMSEAFELYAFDYIVKPFKLERLEQTINKIKELMPTTQVPVYDQGEEINEILLKIKDGMVVLDPKEIIMIERQNRSTTIITEKGTYITNKSLMDMEEILPKKEFIRSHKSYIIRIDKISTISTYGRWTYVVKFKGSNKDALLTKSKAEEMKKRFKIKLTT